MDAVHTLRWGNIVIRNCTDDGELLEPKTKAEYKNMKLDLWLVMDLHSFSENNDIYPVLKCPQCENMKSIASQRGGSLEDEERVCHTVLCRYCADSEEPRFPPAVRQEDLSA